MVEPVDPFEGGILDRLEGAPRPSIADRAKHSNGGHPSRLSTQRCDRFRVALRRPVEAMLAAAIRVMDKAGSLDRPPLMESLLEGVEHEAGMRRAAGPPADDAAGKDVDDEGDVDEAGPGGDVCEVGNPEPVGRRGSERAIDPGRACKRLTCRSPWCGPACPGSPLPAHLPHQAHHRAAGNREALAPQLPPQFPHAVDTEVLLEYRKHRDPQFGILSCPGWQSGRIAPTGDMVVVGRRGDRQHPADRLDPVVGTMVSSMKPIIASVGGRAPPSQNEPTPCAGSRWPDEARGPRAQAARTRSRSSVVVPALEPPSGSA